MSDPQDEILQVLFHDASVGMLLVDTAGRIVRANAALARMLPPAADLTAGRDGVGIFHEAERETVQRALRPGLGAPARRAPIDFAARLIGGTEEAERSAHVSVVALHEPDGTRSGVILRVVDTTEKKRLELQLSHSQKLQAVGQLAGGIAHDFNNLLTAVIGAADLVMARGGVDADTIDDVRQVRASAERGAALVKQLLAYGRQQTLQPRPVAINDAIDKLSAILRRLLPGQVRLELELETPGRTVRVDPTQLDQVLLNLAVNARDAMPNGGTLTVRSGHITLFRPATRGGETIPPGRYVMIEVQDTGTGIPPEVLPRIFDPFFTTRRERGGSGLGLATVQGIVRQSDGYLAADSEVGRGTSMRVYLPRYDGMEGMAIPYMPAPAAAAQSRPGAACASLADPAELPGVGRSRVVLLVEDEDAVRRLAQRALTLRGWEVIAADSAEAALSLLEERRQARGGLDLAVMVSDVVMPGMDGAALVRRVRADWPDLPAILVSGYAADSLRRELESEPMVYLPKPYSLADLTALVAQEVLRAAHAALPVDGPRSAAPAPAQDQPKQDQPKQDQAAQGLQYVP